MERKIQVNWTKLALEFLSMVTSIFLALLANDWYQDRVNRRLGREALGHIRKEILANRQEINDKLPNMKRIQSLLNGYSGTETKSVAVIIGEVIAQTEQGFEMPLIQHAAWDSAQSTGIVKHIPYDMVRELSTMASWEKLFEKRSDRLMSLVYNPDIVDTGKTQGLVVTAKLIASDNLGTLINLLGIYDEILAAIDREI